MPTRVFYDCEFLEDGRTIDLISIGMVTDDGREYYAVNQDMPIRRIRRHPWLMANVVPHLPKGHGEARLHAPKRWLFHRDDPAVKPHAIIAADVAEFLASLGPIELWADYGAYDHVVLAQLWGRMIDLPEGVPMWTHDLRSLVEQHPNVALPEQAGAEHNALADARHLRSCWLILTSGKA